MRNYFFHSLKVRYPDQRIGTVTFGTSSLIAAQRWLDQMNLVPVDPDWTLSAVITDHEPPNPFTAGHGISRLHGSEL